jgi:hypothetical protein
MRASINPRPDERLTNSKSSTVETSRFRLLTRKKANEKRKLAQTPVLNSYDCPAWAIAPSLTLPTLVSSGGFRFSFPFSKSRNSVFRYKGKDVDVQKLGHDLGVAALVSGRVVPRGDSIEISAELVDVRDNTEIWGQHYSGKSADIISLQQQIAGDIAEKLRSKLSNSEKQQVTKQGTKKTEAYESYLKGRYYWNKRTASDIAPNRRRRV